VWNLNQQIAQQIEKNDQLKARNASLDEEVRDLKQGYGAIEERARSELGMVKQDEVFIQVLDANSLSPTKPANSAPVSETKEPAKH
jgi:cell division protein FtsB